MDKIRNFSLSAVLLSFLILAWWALGKDTLDDANMRKLSSGNLEHEGSSIISLRDARFGYSQFRTNANKTGIIDAKSASWIVSNYGPRQNLYPFLIDGSLSGVKVFGGEIRGAVPIDKDWIDIYKNSAAVMVRDAPQVEIYDWKISQAWDGIRIAGSSDGFLIENVEMSTIRDDAVENDFGSNGIISNSMFDGVFSGVSMSHNDLPNLNKNSLTIENVIMRMQSFPFKGKNVHQSPFKVVENSPSLKIVNSVIAIENGDHIGKSRLQLAWRKISHSSDNHFLNLSDSPLPENYPIPGEGWTILQGSAARKFWDKKKLDWTSAHPTYSDKKRDPSLSRIARRVIWPP